jgi:alpha-glucosidase
LAHTAYLTGSPLFPPAFYYFQNDQKMRELYDEKMIGPEILVPTAAQNGDVTRDIYLPAGDWFEYRSKKWFHSSGQTLSWTFKNSGEFVLPYFVRAGAILPIMWVDAATENLMGQRTGGGTITDLNVSVLPAPHSTHFSLFEDDGVSTDYQKGKVAVTRLSQVATGDGEKIDVASTSGTYNGSPASRRTVIRVYLNGKTPRSVTLNRIPLKAFHTQDEFNVQQTSGWFSTADFLIARTDSLPVTSAKTFEIKY